MLLKKYSDFGGGKKKSDSEFLSYNLMLNSEEIKNSNSCVVRKKTTPQLFMCVFSTLGKRKVVIKTLNTNIQYGHAYVCVIKDLSFK